MKNIELKVRIVNMRSLVRRLRVIGARFQGVLNQKDTYYHCDKGRLKVREINGSEFMLIQYNRPDKTSHKISDFEILKLSKRQCEKLKKLLYLALGIKTTVNKKRRLWMYKNTRIHLDAVKDLGEFLELESKIVTSEQNAKKEYDHLLKNLPLQNCEKIKKSYSDLILDNV